ncbi:DUF4267 domain-containing protein [Aspergillus melleus]|uniref:DUF4267 domain-containing protein n=1 Tax=Aspergillus melleus TaxID=138277 RepID=UPI001E8CB8DB|nr:uncharacterized protein LDX57_011595 [Aspergillus melleus]KAH8433959.1 hypothetical protein LDX57_011595 [Aspergillus melleus]
MPLSQSKGLTVAATALATTCIGFGINAILRPDNALTFFEWDAPTSPTEKRIVDDLLAVYGTRDIFMGLAVYSAAYFGSRKALGWILIAIGGVAFGDGAVCWAHGHGQWGHWGYAPVAVLVGALATGLLDRA